MDGRPIVLVEAARARHPTSAQISARASHGTVDGRNPAPVGR